VTTSPPASHQAPNDEHPEPHEGSRCPRCPETSGLDPLWRTGFLS
jgi:hypothetical protein